MLTAFLTTLEQMARIFLFIAVGFGLNRLHILPKGAGVGISRLVTMLLLPALLIYSNMTEFNLANVASYGKLVLLGALFWLVETICMAPVAKKLSGGDRMEYGVYLYGLSFPNSGAVGTPLVLAILGTTGLFEFNLFLTIGGILTYAWGVGLFLEGEQESPVKHFFRQLLNPVFISSMIGLLLGALGAKNWMPTIMVNFVGDLATSYVPISLLMTGYTIADYPLGDVFHRSKSYVFTLFRLILIPVLLLALAWVMGLPKSIAVLLLFWIACPCGMNVVVFPASYGRDCKTGASLVLISCIGSIVTMPILYALVQYFFH